MSHDDVKLWSNKRNKLITFETPLWLNKDVDIDISLQESISKKNDNPELLRLISLGHINKYNTYTNIYTDGSKAENLVAAAALNLNKQFRLCNSSSIYAAKLTAIKEVFSWISENETQDFKKFAIFSDSLSVPISFKKSFSESRPNLLQETIGVDSGGQPGHAPPNN